MIMKTGIRFTLFLAITALALGPPSAEALISRDSSIRPLLDADRVTADYSLSLLALTDRLKAAEERLDRAAACESLCELAAGIEAHPFGQAVAASPFGTQDAWGNYRFTSELATSHNRFGFTGHYWDKEASLYYAKARYYDPFTARFTQADSFLGTLDDPPSLHRYLYANANPTMFVDPTGHIVDKIVDQQIRDSQYTGKYRDSIGWLYNFADAARQQAGYEAANVFTFGALRRQDKLVDQNLEGKITDQQYWNRTGANAALSVTQAALTIVPGGTATTAGGALLRGASTGVLGQGISDVGEVYGTKTKSLEDVRASDYFVAAAMGGLSGYAGYKSRPITIEETGPPPLLVDENWRAKIHGKAQKTKTDGHQFRTYREAIAEAKKPEVVSVHLDHGYNRALELDPKTIAPNRRPDVLAVYEDRTVVRIEVQSRTDAAAILRSRNAALDAQLIAQGLIPTPPRVVVPTQTKAK